MPFFRLLFNREEWYEMYYKNCTYKSVEEWNASGGTPDVALGITWVTIGIVCELTYIPFMISMASNEFIQHSAYKFMFLIGCIDMVTLPCNAIYFGTQTIMGLHYCNSPTINYIVGGLSMSGWYTVSFTACILGLDRFTEIVFPKVGQKLFGGRRAYFWMSLTLAYALFYWGFSQPLIYNNKQRAAFYDPFVNSEFEGYWDFYYQPLMIVHNIAIVLWLGLVYGILCIFITVKAIRYKDVAGMTKLQKIMLLQATAICFELFFVSLVYGYTELFPGVPDIVTKIEHITWLMVHGDTPIIYILLNSSLRAKFFNMLRNYTKKTGNTMFQFATSVYPTRVEPRSVFVTEPQTTPTP